MREELSGEKWEYTKSPHALLPCQALKQTNKQKHESAHGLKIMKL